MSDHANGEHAQLDAITGGLQGGRWSADTSMAAIASLVKRDAADPVRLLQNLESFALAHVASIGRDVTNTGFTNRGEEADSLHRSWRVIVESEPADDLGRWIAAQEEIAPDAVIVPGDKPHLYGDRESFRQLASAIHLALASSPVSGSGARRISELVAQIDNWLAGVGPA